MSTPAQILAQNPGLFQSLVGRDSGYIQSLPGEVKRRINALKNLQKSHGELESKFREEVLALEKKYQVLYRPLYDQRRRFIAGEAEPTEEQATFADPDEEGAEPTPSAQKSGETPVRGIPEFWLTALKNMPQINDMITERDEAALKSLIDIRVSYLDNNPGFKLEFQFEPNEFFSEEVLTKVYFLQNDPESPYDDLLYDHAEGCTISWKEGNDLTVKVETKKQRHKATNKVRIVKKTVPAETFFSFFNPPKAPEPKEGQNEEEENDEDDDLDAKLEEDYEVGEMLKEKIIPHAIDWFTGKALEYDEDIYGDDDDDDDDEEGDDDDEEEDAIPQDPTNPNNWRELIKLQDLLFRDGKTPKAKERIARLVRDKKIAIYAKGMEALPSDTEFVRESLALLKDVDSTAELQSKWDHALKVHRAAITLWLDYLQFRQSDATQFTISGCVAVYEFVVRSIRSAWRDLALVALLIKGYTERAIGAFQALIESNFFVPEGASSKPYESVLDSLQDFWEEGAPRFGEENSAGWASTFLSTLPSTTSETLDGPPQTYDEWAVREIRLSTSSWLPARDNDNDVEASESSDLDRIVLFDDIRNLCFPVKTHFVREQVVYGLLNLLGVSASPLPTSYHPVSSDQFLNNDFADRSRVEAFWPPKLPAYTPKNFRGDGEGHNSWASFRYPSSVFPFTLDSAFGWSAWFPFGAMRDGAATDLDQKSRRAFARNIFRQARTIVSDVTRLDLMAVNFEVSIGTKGAKKFVRQLLSTDRNNILLWNAYAQIERSCGEDNEARKVYQQVLSSGGLDSPEATLTVRLYAELELDNKCPNKAIAALVAFAEGSPIDFSAPEEHAAQNLLSATRVLRAKNVNATVFFTQRASSAMGSPSWPPPLADPALENLSCLALLELATTGPAASSLVFSTALSTMSTSKLPRPTDQSAYLDSPSASLAERLVLHAARFLHRAASLRSFGPISPVLLRESIDVGLALAPINTALLSLLAFNERRARIEGRLEMALKSVHRTHVGWGMAIWEEVRGIGGWSEVVLRGLFEDAAGAESTKHSVALWYAYAQLEHTLGHSVRAKSVFWRGVRECPWAKKLYLLPFTLLRHHFTTAELATVLDLMVEKEIRVRMEYVGLEEIRRAVENTHEVLEVDQEGME
ncbi:hypothetical protein HDU93_007532 [Gonapodya sp. JEL0774]|nr:hypothetical protein HDU93_007532 [Gonapodya sp. JEL0774]